MRRVSNKLAYMSMWILVISLLSQNLAIHVMSTSFEDEKNFYNPSPDPHAGTPPSGSPGSSPPSHSHGTPSVGTPIVPTPSTPSSPTPPGPNSPPFTCNYWRNHPNIIRRILGFWRTLGNVFGVSSSTSVPGFGTHMSLTEALSNTRSDGLGELYRQGTAALLNSMVDNKFHFTTKQVRDNFVASLSSNEVAASQARLFKLANEGKLKPRA